MTDAENQDTPLTAEALYEMVQKKFSTGAALAKTFLSFHDGFGSNNRIGGRRVQVMRANKRAQFLAAELEKLSNRELCAFIGLAVVNKEQAEAAFRYTAIVNFTAPITVLVVLNQIVPGGVFGDISSLDPQRYSLITFLAILAALPILLLVTISQGGVQFARDIYHLALIEESRRGGTAAQPTPSDDADTLNLADL